MAIDFDFASALTPKGRKFRQLQLDSAQADLDQKKANMALQNHIFDVLGGGEGAAPNPNATAGVNGVTQRSDTMGGGAQQPNPLQALLGNDPIKKMLFMRMMQSSPAAAFKMAATGGVSPNAKPSRQVSVGSLGQPVSPIQGQPSYTITDPMAYQAQARANIWTNTFEKEHSKDLMKIQAASADKTKTLDLLADQLSAVNRAKDYKSSVGAMAGATTLYSKALKGKLSDIQDKGLSDAVDDFFNTPSVDKKKLQQVASMIYKARMAERDAMQKQLDSLNENYLKQKMSFFSSPLAFSGQEAPEPEAEEPEEAPVGQ